MTVIAWDGKTLAADKLARNGDTKTTTTKIFRLGPSLLAITGDLSIGMEVAQWYRNGADPACYPPSNRHENSGASLIVICSDKRVMKYESSPVPFRIEGPFCAFGSGDIAALVAMECGMDARAAVEIASKYVSSCGNGVDTLEL